MLSQASSSLPGASENLVTELPVSTRKGPRTGVSAFVDFIKHKSEADEAIKRVKAAFEAIRFTHSSMRRDAH